MRHYLGAAVCRPRAMLATAALAAVALLTSAPQAGATGEDQPPGSIGVRLPEVPTDRVDDPRAATSILDHVAPGGRFTRRIEIVSTVEEPVVVDVYGGNGRIVDGRFVPDDDARTGVGDWVSVDESSPTVPAGGAVTVTLAVDVPNNTPNGEYYGFVWVEPPSSDGQVAVGNRVGVRLYLSVGMGDEPPVDFRVGAMTAARNRDGAPVITTTLRNTGGRALDITGELSLTDGPAGLTAGPFEFDGSLSLSPGELGEMTITLDPELPDGPWTATITAVSGLLERTAQATVLFPMDAGNQSPPEETEIVGGTDEDGNDISDELRRQRRALLPLAALLILLAIGALWLMLLWRRRQEEEDEDADNETAEVVHDG